MSGQEAKSVNDCEVEEIMRNNLELTNESEDKWQFPKPRHYLATVLDSGAVRPLSPTLKVHSPERVFPGIAMICEGFDDMREFKNTIEFVGFFTKKGNLFNSRHHWNMRTKFLEVRLRCMDKIVEDPFAKHKHAGLFYVRVPLAVQKAMEDERRKKAFECENGEKRNKVSEKKTERQINVNTDIENESSFDEKLHRESQQQGLNVESRRDSETLNSLSGSSREYKHYSASELPGSSASECGHFYPSNDGNVQDLVVTGKAIEFQPSVTTELEIVQTGNSKSEKHSSTAEDELVLEDINDKDSVPDGLLPSACKLERTPAMTTSASRELVKQQQVRTLSRFQRLRRRIRTLFSCFGNNQVTPVDI